MLIPVSWRSSCASALGLALVASIVWRGAADAKGDDRAALSRAHQVWRRADVHAGSFSPLTTIVNGRPVVFLVDRRSGNVECVDIATAKGLWSVSPPKAPALERLPSGPPTRMGKPSYPADETALSLAGDVLLVRWRPRLEWKLAIGDGHLLSTAIVRDGFPKGWYRPQAEARWRVTADRLEELKGAGRSFPLPPPFQQLSKFLAAEVLVLESGDRFVLVQSADRADPHAILATWTAQAPKPVVLRRPSAATDFELFGNLLLAVVPFDAAMVLDLSKLDPPLSTLSPADAVAAARAESGQDERLLYSDLEPLPQLGAYWLERLRDGNDPMHPLALQAIADHPVPEALPFLLAEEPGPRTAAALEAQDDPRAGARLLDLERAAAGNRWDVPMYRAAALNQLWRNGRTSAAGLCKPGDEHPLVALSRTAADQAIGTAHPFLFQDVASDGSWTVLCQAREDTDRDGHIDVMLGHHGEPMGDEMRPYLVVGSGPGAAFDEILAADPTGRYVAARGDACLSLVDTRRRTEIVLRDADLRDADQVFGPPRGASFDARGEHLLYLRHSARGDRLIVRTLATGAESEVDPGAGVLWRAYLDPGGRWLMADKLPDRRWPQVMTSLATRTCRGAFMSYSAFGMSFYPTVSHSWAPLGVAGPMQTVAGLVVPFGDGVLVRGDDGALVRLGARGARTELVPVACHGIVVGVDRRGRTVAVVCSPPGQDDGTLTLFGGGPPVSLGNARVPGADRWAATGDGLVEWGEKLIDLERRELVPRTPGCCGLPGRRWEEQQKGIFARRADGAVLRTTKPPAERSGNVPNGPLKWVTPKR